MTKISAVPAYPPIQEAGFDWDSRFGIRNRLFN